MMELKEIQALLQRYFNGQTTEQEEQKLSSYFASQNVAKEVQEYAGFFGGISELSEAAKNISIEEDVMDFILEHDSGEKTKFRKLWLNVTGIAAAVVIALGGFLFYQQQQQPFEDTFNTPEEALAYAQETLQFMSGKYNKGLASFSNFEKLQKGSKEISKGIAPVNDFFKQIEGLKQAKTTETIQADSL